jgi:hypothetical protein
MRHSVRNRTTTEGGFLQSAGGGFCRPRRVRGARRCRSDAPGVRREGGDDEDGSMQLHNVLAGEDFEDQEPHGQARSGAHAESAECPEEVQWASHVAEKETDGEQVEEDADGARETVVGLPCCSRRVGDGHFADAGTEPGGERGDEPMHFAVQGDVLDDFAAIGLEGGAEVVNVNSTEDCHEPVGCMRGDAAEKEVVGALGSPAADDVVAFFEFCEEGGYLVGVVLEVAIHREDVVSL